MLFVFEDASRFDINSEKDLLIREADEAFNEDDKISCVDAINRLYDILDLD